MPKKDPFIPDVIVIGAQKSGTSTFYRNLVVKEKLVFTKQKESNILIKFKDPLKIIQGYRSSFSKLNYPMIDVSPRYSQRHLFPNAAENLRDLNPSASIIYIVRDPIERIKSQLHHNLLRDRFHSTIEKELLVNQDYIRTSSYHYQIQPFLKNFPRNQLFVYPFEKMIHDPILFQKELFRFIGTEEKPIDFKPFNVSEERYVIKYHDWFHTYFNYYPMIKFYHFFWRVMGIKPEKIELTSEAKQDIYTMLAGDVDEFIKEFDLDRSWWKSYNTLSTVTK
jgi:hypothetical protein